MNHKKYVGGHWDTAGKIQFDFMVKEGLKSEHVFLDIGCGSLRGGRYFVDYLNENNYFGIDHHMWLIQEGINGLKDGVYMKKKPIFLVAENFEFEIFKKEFDFALAKSVFTHLTKDRIKLCFEKLKPVLNKDGVFYASIFLGDSKKNLEASHDNKRFMYSIKEIEELAVGWNVEPKGHGGCGRQTMLKFTIK